MVSSRWEMKDLAVDLLKISSDNWVKLVLDS